MKGGACSPSRGGLPSCLGHDAASVGREEGVGEEPTPREDGGAADDPGHLVRLDHQSESSTRTSHAGRAYKLQRHRYGNENVSKKSTQRESN